MEAVTKPGGGKSSTLAIRVCQVVLLATGLILAKLTGGHLDETQVPGFLIALAISWWLTPEIRTRALKLGLVDKPGEERRIHKVAVPRLGGVAIFMSVMLTITVLIALTGRFPREARAGESGLTGIAIGGTLVFVLGLIDDLESLPAKVKFIIQLLAGCAAYSLGVRIKSIPIPWDMDLNLIFTQWHITAAHGISLGWFGLPLTVLWLVGVANAVNLIDGMDGLAAGVSAISALTIWTIAIGLDRDYVALTAAVLTGALLGFLRWNFNPARIFLGDSGAYLVGFILGAISIMGVVKGAADKTVLVPTFVLVILILFFPLLDTTWAIVRRLARGKSPFKPDGAHIHHRLLNTGLSQKNVAYIIYGISSVLGLIATFLVHRQVYFLWLTGSVLVMALFFSEVLNRHRQRGSKAGPQPAPEEDGFIAEERAPE